MFQLKQVKSQILIDTNKVWSVVECINFGGCGSTFYKFKGDTILGVYHYKKLCGADSSMTNWSYEYAMREDSSKKVFLYSNIINDMLFYDFSLNVGDTFSTNLNGCSFQMVVDSVDSVMLLSGEIRKRLFLSHDTWIEGIGSIAGLTYVGLYFCYFDIYPELICFIENDTLKYHNSYYPTCYYSSLSINEIRNGQNTMLIFPNPFQDNLNINSKESIKGIEIYTYDGKRIYSESFFNPINLYNYNLSTSSLKQGIYLIKIVNIKNNITYEKIIKI